MFKIMNKNIWVIVLLCSIANMNVTSAAIPVSEPKQVVLQRFDLPGTNYHHCGMSMTTFAPNSIKSRHEHTGPEVGFVLEGELILKLEGHPAQTVQAGESFQIPMNVFHTTQAGPKGAKVIATWLLLK